MRIAISTLLLFVTVAFAAGCSDDSSSPQNDGPASFAQSMGSTNHQTIVTGVAVLSDGTRMVSGRFDGALQVTGSTDVIQAGGFERSFVAAFRPDGSLARMGQIGGSSANMRRMARDRDDNLLFVGSFSGNTSFGSTPLTSVGLDIIFAKMTPNGGAIFVKSGSGSGSDAGMDITSGSDGSIYMTGVAGSEISVAGEDVGQNGHSTGFIVQMGSDGAGVWQGTGTVTAGSSTCDGVSVSADGTIVVCGYYNGGSLAFSTDVITNDGGSDGFVERFDTGGVPLGAVHIGGTGDITVNDVTTVDNNAIVTGSFSGTADFDATGSGGAVTASGALNGFVARYTKAGALRWVKTIKGDNAFCRSIARLADGHVVVCGEFTNPITVGSKTLTSTGGPDIFIVRLDGDGNILSANKLGGIGGEENVEVTATGSTAIIVGGSASNPIIFPDGSRRKTFGSFDGYIFQQP
ncbi:MAG TPA: hypothetical protein VJS69_02600 [Candidatus Krumholzibacteria bacterium]|nr:hypothetical protein [Candidatus Krumholzibacteria bacterium]